jgi:Fe-S-cluster containining protein
MLRMKRKKSLPEARKAAPAKRDLAMGGYAQEMEARRCQRLQTVETLKAGRTPLQLIDVADSGARVAEQAVRTAKEADPPPPSACQEGCDWCCYLTVGTSVPEVVRIVEYLRQTLSPEELQATRQRVAELEERKRRRGLGQRDDARAPCALLVNHRCLAYPVRPLTCRGFNSSDAHLCELFLQSPRKAVIPTYVPQLRLMTFVLDGMRAGLAESGLPGDLVELTAALRIALEVPDAAQRWLAGEAVFAPARLN